TNLGSLMNIATGRPEVARRLMAVAAPVVGITNAPSVYAKLGDTAPAMGLVGQMESTKPRALFTDVQRASVLLAIGDTARALTALEQSARTAGPLWISLIPLLDPAYDPVRQSARFAALVRQAGL